MGSVTMSKYLNYGVGEKEKEILFDTLPQLSALHSVASTSSPGKQGNVSATKLQQQHDEAIPIERFKSRMLARVISLKNANAKGIAFENRRRIITTFSEPSNPHDPGRPEVQGMFPPSNPALRRCLTRNYSRSSDVQNPKSLGPPTKL